MFASSWATRMSRPARTRTLMAAVSTGDMPLPKWLELNAAALVHVPPFATLVGSGYLLIGTFAKMLEGKREGIRLTRRCPQAQARPGDRVII